MTNKEKIIKRLSAKGYTGITAEFEPISYYSSGREGGWTVAVHIDDDNTCFPDWSTVKKPEGLIVDIFENDFMCFNIADALSVIELLPHFNSNTSTK